jgi:hypothetical protein
LSNPEENPKKNEQNNQSWSVEKLATFLSGLIPLADRYLNYKNNESKADSEYLNTTSKHDIRIITILLAFLGALMGALVWLTATGKINGESLLFAIGLTIGYVFAIVQRFIFGSQRPVGNPNPE